MRAEAVQPQHMVLWNNSRGHMLNQREINDNKMQLLVVFICVQLCHNYIIQSTSQCTSSKVSSSNKAPFPMQPNLTHVVLWRCGQVVFSVSGMRSEGLWWKGEGGEEEFGGGGRTQSMNRLFVCCSTYLVLFPQSWWQTAWTDLNSIMSWETWVKAR